MKKIEEEVKAISNAIVTAWNDGNYEAFMNQIDTNAIFYPPGDSPIAGIDAIKTVYKTYFEIFNFEVNETIDEVTGSGDYCYVIGNWSGSMHPIDGSSPIHYNNKLLTIYKKQEDDTWRIYRNIFNTSNPQ